MSDRAAVSSEGIKADAATLSGLNMVAARLSPGAISESSSTMRRIRPPCCARAASGQTAAPLHVYPAELGGVPTRRYVRDINVQNLLPIIRKPAQRLISTAVVKPHVLCRVNVAMSASRRLRPLCLRTLNQRTRPELACFHPGGFAFREHYGRQAGAELVPRSARR